VELNHLTAPCLVSRRIVIAYWLIPAEPAHSFFRGVIDELAHRYSAPVFEPHLTIHVGPNRKDAVEKALSKVAYACEGIALHALDVSHSAEFIKTLFVQFALNTKLRRLHQSIRNAASNSSTYQLKPHLSLIYKKLSAQRRRMLARSIKIPFSEVIFDSIKVVRCVSPTQNRADVETWRVVAATEL
jgi:2'-5' RNA ligase